MDIIDVLEEVGLYPNKKSALEYCSPCPYCKDGKDRFTIWPNSGTSGRFWCRVCDEKGDAINLLRDHQGLTYKQACEKLKLEPTNSHTPKRELSPIIAENPPNTWIENATKFLEWCHTQLISKEEYLSVLISRGINLETIENFKLGYNPSKIFFTHREWGLPEECKKDGSAKKIWVPPGPIIPTFEDDKLVKLKIRNIDFEKEMKWYESEKEKCNTPKYMPSKYVVFKGSKKSPAIYGNEGLDTLLVLESELDAILVCQEAGNHCFCLALGGSTQPLDLHKERIVRGVERILFSPDFDEAGKASWDKWLKRFPDMKLLLTPDGKDPTEAFQLGVDLQDWVKQAVIN